MIIIALILLVALIFARLTFLIVPMRENVIQERLGKYYKTLKPGLHLLIPIIDTAAYKQELREQVLDVPSQSCITSDNIQVEVDGLVYIKVENAYKASYGIANYRNASINLAQTTMRSEIGKIDLDNTFSERENLNTKIVKEIDRASNPWGIKVTRYEIKNIEPSDNITETMEKQMEAEREKRAEITLSSGEKQARINVSEGDKQAAINLSEGEKQQRINEANGRAKEIELIAGASATGIAVIAKAIALPNGADAVNMQLVEQYIAEYGKVIDRAAVSVLPVELASLRSLVKSISAPLSGSKGAKL